MLEAVLPVQKHCNMGLVLQGVRSRMAINEHLGSDRGLPPCPCQDGVALGLGQPVQARGS